MKSIGQTDDGNMLIEVTRSEFEAFAKLTQVIDGKSPWDLSYRSEYHSLMPVDLTSAFDAILIFVMSKGIINEVKRLIGDIDDILMRQSKEKNEGIDWGVFKDDK